MLDRTLEQHNNLCCQSKFMTWEGRLIVAYQVAEALYYCTARNRPLHKQLTMEEVFIDEANECSRFYCHCELYSKLGHYVVEDVVKLFNLALLCCKHDESGRMDLEDISNTITWMREFFRFRFVSIEHRLEEILQKSIQIAYRLVLIWYGSVERKSNGAEVQDNLSTQR
ncbi:unnamed protein product [Cuscuta europaea]|uniref:Uncharacterized protein n=1 Tax=Cuscuta europaea TaxID=41803 RepID=A0A9P0ZGT0_CUSEU|nr:unnamed protein product [Cuscuta europaea]CAH9099828.1 unnamed protein product [Cuscuta europaea]